MDKSASTVDEFFNLALAATNKTSQAVVSLAGEIQELARQHSMPTSVSFAMGIANGVCEKMVATALASGHVSGAKADPTLTASIVSNREMRAIALQHVEDYFALQASRKRRERKASPEALQATTHTRMDEANSVMSPLESAGQALLNAEKQAERDAAPAQEMTTKATPVPPGVEYSDPIAAEGTLMVPGVDDRAGRGKYPAKKKRK